MFVCCPPSPICTVPWPALSCLHISVYLEYTTAFNLWLLVFSCVETCVQAMIVWLTNCITAASLLSTVVLWELCIYNLISNLISSRIFSHIFNRIFSHIFNRISSWLCGLATAPLAHCFPCPSFRPSEAFTWKWECKLNSTQVTLNLNSFANSQQILILQNPSVGKGNANLVSDSDFVHTCITFLHTQPKLCTFCLWWWLLHTLKYLDCHLDKVDDIIRPSRLSQCI